MLALWFISLYEYNFFVSPDETINPKPKELHLPGPDPLCVVFFCKPWGLMTLQKEETIPRPVSCSSPSWTICWHFCSWWLPFEPCGGYLEAQACEVTSEGVTFCLLEVTRRDFDFCAMTWQILCSDNASLAWLWASYEKQDVDFPDLQDYMIFFSFSGCASQSLFGRDCSVKDHFPVDHSLLMHHWLAKFLPGSETDVWSNSTEGVKEICLF